MSIYNSNAKSNINVGAAANDGTGDPLRSAFEKVNNNFFDLYTFLGNGTHLGNISQANFGNITIGNINLTGAITTTGSAPTSFTGTVTAGNLNLTGNLVSGTIGPGVVFPSTGVTAGHYGNSTHYVGLIVNDSGRITSANLIAASGGPVGAQGVQGAQGNQGQGVQGAQGNQGTPAGGGPGSQGVQGAQGNQGQGVQGAQGNQGTSGGGSDSFNSLGVGTAASGTQGEIRATNNITAYYSSDRRLKENIRRIETPINLTKQITGIRFDWADNYINNAGGEDGYFVRKNDIGVIAQEVESVLPEIVANRPDGYKAIKYEKLVALLVESVKELDSEVKSINEKLVEINKKLL